MNELFHYLSNLSPVWLYLIIFGAAFVENIFPPSPSDIIIVIGGALAGMNKGNVYLALIASTIGSTLGFMAMYYIGAWFGAHIIENTKWKHIPRESIHRVEGWFTKYGYAIIIANRFLSGTRAVVSFFAGMSRLEIFTTTWLSFVSSAAWYGFLIFGGFSLGRHWRKIDPFLETYSKIISIVVLVIIASSLFMYYRKKYLVKTK